MKHIFFKTSKIATGIALASFLTLVTVPSSAKSSKKEIATAINISPVVKFSGTDENGAAFISVSFETIVPVKFEVVMTDVQGNEFFSREFEASRFSKYFKLVNESGENEMNMNLTICFLGTGETHSFNVNGSLQTVNTVGISKS